MQLFGYEVGLFYARKVQEATQQRSVSLTSPVFRDMLGLDISGNGMEVSNNSIMGVPPAWSAIRYISEGIASLDRGVYRRQSDGDVFPDYVHPLAQLFEGRVHSHHTTFDFLQALIANACLGNGYARIYRDPVTNNPTALEVIPQDIVTIETTASGELFYRISGYVNEAPVNVLIPETEMLHIKGVTMTGIAGRPLRIVHKSAFGKAQGSQQYANTYFDKGASVGGLITFPNPLTPEQRKMLRDKLEAQHAGVKNAGSMMVLDAGADFKAIQSTPRDSMVIDFSNLSTVECSQIFKVPLHLLSQLDRSTFSNMEQQNQDFAIHCLRPWARKIEEEINSKLLTTNEVKRRKVFFAFDLSALTMGDMTAQAAFFASAIQNGWMTPNEVRARKNLNKIEGGDQLFIQQNMAPMQDLHDILEAKYGKDQAAQGAQDANPPDSQDPNSNDQPGSSNANG